MFRTLFIITLMGIFLLALPAVALAAPAEKWTADPTTGVKICVMFMDDSIKLVSASWSGPLVDGKVEGKGTLNWTYREKDGKGTKGQADGGMKAGKLDGHVSIKWSDGDAYDGDYRAGLRDGKGVFKFADSRVYEGVQERQTERLRGLQGPDGKVIYEGQWKDGNPVAAATTAKADNVLGIPLHSLLQRENVAGAN